jgi:hypothetical protein
MKYDFNKTLWEAPLHKTFVSLSRALGMNGTMLRYNLAKDRKLDLILKILAINN